ncbi:MAG TPA: CocE/NonD family hydrolase, partial [Burkholderiales bacterium]|nr:CocE/NonD family hydrolase [Burkholderiales bacterium]
MNSNDPHERTEVRDGMRITWHQRITVDDGLVLRADVYRPVDDKPCPVILTYGVYGKGLAYQDGYPLQWNKMVSDYPEILKMSSNKYQNWETTDPECWVPNGYAVVRVDSRGAGWSPGFMDPGSHRETLDLFQCIEWAGTQPWSNGKVGMLGISYYASNQWRVACMHPKHL